MTTTPIERLSYSAATLHRTCPQAWNYRHIQRLERDSTTPAVALQLGSWWHALRAADSIHRGHAGGTLRSAPDTIECCDDGPVLERVDGDDLNVYRALDADGRQAKEPAHITAQTILTLADTYWRSLSGDVKDLWREKMGSETLTEHLVSMERRYRDRWKAERGVEQVVAVELNVTALLPGTSTQFVGIVDEVYYDPRRNLYVARDHKTGATLAAGDATEDLMDSQLQLYAWAVGQRLAHWGITLGAVAYDRVRTKAPTTPQLTQTGTLSKSVTDYDLSTYLAWASTGPTWGEEGAVYKSGPKKGSPKFGTYTVDPAVVERLSSPSTQSVWHQRTLTPLNRHVIVAHLAALATTADDMAVTTSRVEEAGEAPRNLTRRACGWCEFSSLCLAQMMGGPDGEYPLEDHGLRAKKPRRGDTTPDTEAGAEA